MGAFYQAQDYVNEKEKRTDVSPLEKLKMNLNKVFALQRSLTRRLEPDLAYFSALMYKLMIR